MRLSSGSTESSPPAAMPLTSAWKRRPRLFTSTMSPGAMVRNRTERTLREGSAVQPEVLRETDLAEQPQHALGRGHEHEPLTVVATQAQQAPVARGVHEGQLGEIEDERPLARVRRGHRARRDRRGGDVERAG